jgi:hypothetical protein
VLDLPAGMICADKELEETLGTALLERSVRRARLTALGEDIADRCYSNGCTVFVARNPRRSGEVAPWTGYREFARH